MQVAKVVVGFEMQGQDELLVHPKYWVEPHFVDVQTPAVPPPRFSP